MVINLFLKFLIISGTCISSPTDHVERLYCIGPNMGNPDSICLSKPETCTDQFDMIINFNN